MDSVETQTGSGYTRQQKIILAASLAGEFFAFSCLSIPAPFLPKLDELHHIGSDLTGWILGLLPLVQFVLSPACGKLMSYLSPEFMFVYGLFSTGVTTALFGMLDSIPLPPSSENQVDPIYLVVAMVTRIAQAIGSCVVLTAALALLSTKFASNKLTILSYSEMAIGLGIMAGPALGSGFYKIGGFQLIFYGIGGIMIVLFFLVWFLLPHKVRVEGCGEERGKSSFKPIFTNCNILLALLITALSGTLWSSIDPILEPELRTKFNLSEELCSLTFLLMSVPYILTAPMVAKLMGKMKGLDPRMLLVFGFSTASVAFVFFGPSPLFPHLHRPLWMLLLCLAVLGFAQAFIIVPCISLLSLDERDPLNPDQEVMNDAIRALVMSMWNSAYCIGGFTGPTFSGVATKHGTFGWTMTYYSIGCIAMTAALLVVKGLRSCKKNRCVQQRGHEETTSLLYNNA